MTNNRHGATKLVDAPLPEVENVSGETKERNSSRVAFVSVVKVIVISIGIILFVGGAALYGMAHWTRRMFGEVSVDQILLNLDGAGTAGGGGAQLVRSGIIWGLIVPIVVAAMALLVSIALLKRLSAGGTLSRVGSMALVASLAFVPVMGARDAVSTFGVGQYISSAQSKAQLADYYIVPTSNQLSVEANDNPLNLVLIYMESIENDMADDSLFEVNMLENLQGQTAGWETIEDFRQYPGGGFTMSGIVSTQCGIPLRNGDVAAGDGNGMNDFGAQVSDYLPGAVCVGDLLEERGYSSVFIGGASGDFSGKKRYFESHGYSTFYGLEEWVEIGETEIRPDWGLSDRRLFLHAKEQVDELYASAQPFNLTVLTLDTHPGLYVHDSCPVTTEDPAVSVYKCSTDYVADFVAYMEEQGYLENTVVVVMGDHLKQVGEGNAFHEELADAPHTRTVFNRIWSPQEATVVATSDQFGMYPTILELLGYDLDRGRAGIGVSSFYASEDADTVRSLDREEYVDLIHSRSSGFYDMLWQIPSEYTLSTAGGRG